MIEFYEEPNPTAVFAEVHDLLLAHKEEVSTFGEGIPLDPDWDMYEKLSELGMFHVVTARTKDGTIVGYSSTFMVRHMHYAFKMANNDIIYLKPEYRGYGIRLIRFTEDCLKRKGVKFSSIGIKPHIDFSPVVKRAGYELLESIYFRRIQ